MRNSWLSRDRVVAGPRFNRWWTLVAALAVNVCLGQVHALVALTFPLTRGAGGTAPAGGAWTLTELAWVVPLAYVFVGLSAGVSGRWQDRVGPRASGVAAAVCFGGGLALAAVGVAWHELWLLYLGYGVIGGSGLGVGFNTSAAALVRWFPDRRGFACGVAATGFGAGALMAATTSRVLVERFASSLSAGVAETLLVVGGVACAAMLGGALLFRLPPPGRASEPRGRGAMSDAVEAREALSHLAVRSPQFGLLWLVLFVDVTVGIGVWRLAAAMVQGLFGGLSAQVVAWFATIFGLFSIGGALAWASVSDMVGRRLTYALVFSLGSLCCAAVPVAGRAQNLTLFIGLVAVLLSLVGGGIASMPAYVADIFGSRDFGAVHGRLLTALSVAAVLGSVTGDVLRDFILSIGIAHGQVYSWMLWTLAAGLLLGLACNANLHPLPGRPFGADRSGAAVAQFGAE